MRNRAFLVGSFIFLVLIGVDLVMYLNGMKVLGIFSFLASLLVFASGMVWLIYRDDSRIYFRKPILLIPIAIFGAAVTMTLQQVPLYFRLTPENLEEAGNLLMSRYQIGLWIISILIFFLFIMASSLMGGERR